MSNLVTLGDLVEAMYTLDDGPRLRKLSINSLGLRARHGGDFWRKMFELWKLSFSSQKSRRDKMIGFLHDDCNQVAARYRWPPGT
jgi:hypothetical protein